MKPKDLGIYYSVFELIWWKSNKVQRYAKYKKPYCFGYPYMLQWLSAVTNSSLGIDWSSSPLRQVECFAFSNQKKMGPPLFV